MGRDLVPDQPGVGVVALREDGPEQGGLAARAGTEVEPARVSPLDVGAREGERDELAALVLHPRAALPDGGQRVGRPESRTANGDSAPGSPPSSAGVARPGSAASDTAGAALSAASSAGSSAASRPENTSASRKARTIHTGWDAVSASRASSSAPAGTIRSSQPARSCSATRRRTALAKPAAPWPTSARTTSTVAETAACAGTRMPSSWCAPSRSASSRGGSICSSGRSTHAASTAS